MYPRWWFNDQEEAMMIKQFQTELETLSKYRHENIVPFLGFSVDGREKCLVYATLTVAKSPTFGENSSSKRTFALLISLCTSLLLFKYTIPSAVP
jgi:serine/threonine protein kinase